MSPSPRQRATGSGRTGLLRAEAALVEQYTRLARLAYLTLPPSLSRHRRVLVAHSLTQRALPGIGGSARQARRVPQQRSAPGAESAWVLERVLRSALAYERRPWGWPKALPSPRSLRPTLPVVWGLRLFPRAGGAEEVALGQALSRVPAAARAAFVLRRLDGLADAEIERLLTAAGVPRPREALRAARRLDSSAGPAAEVLADAREFDACSVQTRPTDLLRRRRRVRGTWLVATAAAATALTLTVSGTGTPSPATRAPVPVAAFAPGQLVRAPSDAWADTSRVDFTVWPARGERIADRALLTRALDAWTDPRSGARGAATTASAATTGPPGRSTQLLYAGEVDGRAVVLFHGGQHTVRYSEPLSSPGEASSPGGASSPAGATLDFARADDADVTTAAAVAVSREGGRVRYLVAPWIAESQTRDLLRPDSRGAPGRIG